MTREEYTMVQSATRLLTQAVPGLRSRDQRTLELLRDALAMLKALELGARVVVPKEELVVQ